MLRLVWLIPTLPLISSFLLFVLGRRWKLSESAVSLIACGSVLLSLIITLGVIWDYATSGRAETGQPYISSEAGGFPHSFTWMLGGQGQITYGPEAGQPAPLYVEWSYQVDPLSCVMMFIVTFVGFLIHVFAVGYMRGDGGYYRFFAELNLFMFMMLTLVMGSNFVMMFVGWEGVGLCSYLLIGYFFARDDAQYASTKAFIVNRIGDFGFMLAMFGIFSLFGTWQFSEVFQKAADDAYLPMEQMWGWGLASWLALGLFIGATGKSAQIPLYVWLPDAMAGPTPVSALIHAATMVTAGVYMVARTNVIFQKSPTMMFIVAVIGLATALLAAFIAFAQNDIKKVLAYSTISQLGYMFLGCGVGAFTAGIFHVFTHAFFKALMFLGAGSVIVALHHQQDMRQMGGLAKYMPTTYKTFLIGWLAICGIIPFAGFFSKDEILWRTYSTHAIPGGPVLWLFALIGAMMTAFYMTRLMAMTFWGEPRFATAAGHHHHGLSGEHDQHHGPPTESPRVMTIPLIILAAGSALAGFLGVPAALGGSNRFEHWLDPIIYKANATHGAVHAATHGHDPMEYVLMAVSVLAAAGVMYMAYTLYIHRRQQQEALVESLKPLYAASVNKLWVDDFYEAVFVRSVTLGSSKLLWKTDVSVVDGGVNGSAWFTRMSSAVSGWFDTYVVDLLVNALGFFMRIFSVVFRAAQTGLAQNYALVIVAGLLIATAAYFFWGS
ncbi:MAG: NADH-quinone oxidoreductase subunit L [Acidobacteriota bacterium]|nr:NADH-quinone oxidoreductase subunit L [Blastocatellia bacterium]MDW8239507.1 NADH-quinone oxidoreductase subunit L [Acidobacteriota bacterium]